MFLHLHLHLRLHLHLHLYLTAQDYVWDMNEQVMYWIAAASHRPLISEPMVRSVGLTDISIGISICLEGITPRLNRIWVWYCYRNWLVVVVVGAK